MTANFSQEVMPNAEETKNVSGRGHKLWPNFYFTPIDEGKHLWLGVQGACIVLCLIGAFLATKGIGRAMDAAVMK